MNRWDSINMLFVYGIIGYVANMITALGIVGQVLSVAGLVAVVVGVVKIIMTLGRHEKVAISSWVLLVVYALLFYFGADVSIG